MEGLEPASRNQMQGVCRAVALESSWTVGIEGASGKQLVGNATEMWWIWKNQRKEIRNNLHEMKIHNMR